MTIEEIRKGAPDGATDYVELNLIGSVEYFKVYRNGSIFVWDDMWHRLVDEQYGYIKPKLKPLY